MENKKTNTYIEKSTKKTQLFFLFLMLLYGSFGTYENVIWNSHLYIVKFVIVVIIASIFIVYCAATTQNIALNVSVVLIVPLIISCQYVNLATLITDIPENSVLYYLFEKNIAGIIISLCLIALILSFKKKQTGILKLLINCMSIINWIYVGSPFYLGNFYLYDFNSSLIDFLYLVSRVIVILIPLAPLWIISATYKKEKEDETI